MARHLTVVGAGIFGLCCGWELTRRGARVTVIEAERVGAGSSGGTVGALSPHAPGSWNPKKQTQLDALIAAERWWDTVRDAGGTDPLYARNGRLQPVAPGAEAQARARVQAAAQDWPAPFRMTLTDAPAGALVPDSASGLWLADNLTARISPRAACAALAAAIRASGGEIVESAGLQRPEDLPQGAIWATGAQGLADLGRDLGHKAGDGVHGQSALLAHAAPDAPQVFAEGLHIVPHADGTTAIGSTSEPGRDDTATDDQLETLIARARALCPQLAGARVLDRWAGIRPRAASRAPLVGHWPGRPGHFIANGGFKIGFAMAPAVAAMLAELILNDSDRIPTGFRPG